MSSRHNLDPHARPPEPIRDLYKRCQKLKAKDIAQDLDVLDFQRPGFESDSSIKRIDTLLRRTELSSIFGDFDPEFDGNPASSADIYVYEHTAMPGRI
jgi:alkylated DNA repair protein alkB family protein 1